MLKITMNKRALNFQAELGSHPRKWREGIKEGAMLAGRSIQKRITTNLSTGSRSGRKYRNLPHRSSAPGENPRSQSGGLVRGVYFDANDKRLVLGNREDHAAYLTKGTKYMKARPHKDLPFYELAMEQEERNTENYLRNGVRRKLC